MLVWFTADLHLGHTGIIPACMRPFESVEEMNETLIQNYNTLVGKGDTVYILGDLMLGNSAKGIDCIKRMGGKLHIVRGNHDTDTRWEMYSELPNVVEQSNAIIFKYKKHHFYLSHYPTLTGNLEKESLTQMTLNLFGHTHQKTNFYMDMPYMYHCGIDSHDCKPVLLDNIIEEMYAKVKECKEFLDETDEE